MRPVTSVDFQTIVSTNNSEPFEDCQNIRLIGNQPNVTHDSIYNPDLPTLNLTSLRHLEHFSVAEREIKTVFQSRRRVNGEFLHMNVRMRRWRGDDRSTDS